jgi:hypothetical protein
MDLNNLHHDAPFYWRDKNGNLEKKPPFRRQKTSMDREIICVSDFDLTLGTFRGTFRGVSKEVEDGHPPEAILGMAARRA